MNRVLLLPNPLKQTALEACRQVVPLLKTLGHTVLADAALEELLGGLDKNIVYLPPDNAFSGCDFILVLGGDGTILNTAARAARLNKPILGVNMGTIGFMTELEMSELDLLGQVSQKDFVLDKRSMLDVTVEDKEGGVRFAATVLNEAAVNKGTESKLSRLTVYIDGAETVTFNGDGVIVATPTGSTAYSLAAGGPILAPASSTIAVTPICPLYFNMRSFVVNDLSEIVILPQNNLQPPYLSPDGFRSWALEPQDRVRIRKADCSLSLMRLKGMGFYERIRVKLSNT